MGMQNYNMMAANPSMSSLDYAQGDFTMGEFGIDQPFQTMQHGFRRSNSQLGGQFETQQNFMGHPGMMGPPGSMSAMSHAGGGGGGGNYDYYKKEIARLKERERDLSDTVASQYKEL